MTSLAKVGFNFYEDGIVHSQIMPLLSKEALSILNEYVINAVFIVLMLASNALMLKFYVKSMHVVGAAKATVYNFAINYVSSVSPSLFIMCLDRIWVVFLQRDSQPEACDWRFRDIGRH